MRKHALRFAIVLVLMMLAACGKTTPTAAPTTPPPAPTATTEPASPKIEGMKKLVAVFSYEDNYWSQMHENEGLINGLTERGFVEGENIEITRIYMNIKTVNKTAEQKKALVPGIVAQIEAVNPDAIFVVEDDALIYVGSEFLDKEVPVVFAGVNSFPDKESYCEKGALADSLERPGHNVTGVLERLALRGGVELIHQIVPDAKKAIFISDDSSLTYMLMEGGGGEEELKGASLEIVETVYTNDYDKLKQAVLDAQNKADVLVLLTPFSMADADGTYVPQQDVVAWILQNNKLPTVGYLDVLIEEGILAGTVVDLRAQGYHAGLMISRILLDGESPAEMPIIDPVANRVLLNLAHAEQLGITIPFEIIESADQVYTTMTSYPEYKMKEN